jgi:4-amino-4-deoxy-L-arabinose transferase-like glycosyltransferase
MSDATGLAAPAAPAPRQLPSPLRRASEAFAVVAIVAAAWAALQGFALSRAPFHTRGEPREAVVVQDLVRRGDWILPRRNGAALPRKPPLFYWLAAVAARARGGVDEASVRLPSAVLSGVACALLAAVTTVIYGALSGTVSGLTLLTSFEWLRAATTARVDMTLAFGLALAFAGLLLFRRVEHPAWLLLVYAGAAWATLSKGIPGLVIPIVQVLLLCAVVDRSFAFARRLRPLSGLLAVLTVSGLWYAAAAVRGGRDFVSIVVDENLVRALGTSHFALGHRHSIVYLVFALLAGLLPWTVLLPSVAVSLWRDRRGMGRCDPRRFAILWIVAVFALYAFATSKRGVYLLPLYPAVCLLVGWWAAQAVRGRVEPRWLLRVLAPLAWVLAAVLALLAVVAGAQAAGLPLLDSAASLFGPRPAFDLACVAAAVRDHAGLALCLAMAAAAAAALASGARARRCGVALASLFVGTAAVIIAVRAVVLPAIGEGYTRRPFAAALRRAVADPLAVHTTDSLDYGTLFYWDAAMPVYDPKGGGDVPPYLLSPEAAWLRMSAAERLHYRRLPGLRVEHGGDQGYVAVLQRREEADPHPAAVRQADP